MNISDLKGKRIALAASGGLDSCTVTRWLSDHGAEVISMTADLGQPDEKDLNIVRERMITSGAKEAILLDLRQELASAGMKCLQAGAVYEGGYWNTTGIARHITVQGLLKIMQEKNIPVMAHGATGRGNDQVRFALAAHMLAPDVEVYAPWRDNAFLESFGGRSEMIHFCQKNKIPVTSTLEKPYSTDANLLGLTHEAGKLEDLDTPADFIDPVMGVFPMNAPDQSETVTIRFVSGIPVAINQKPGDPLQIFEVANEIGGRHGVGIGIHVIENRFVGIKSRGIYESPGLCLLHQAFEFLLEQILDRRARCFYQGIQSSLAEQIYQGYYYDLASQMQLSALLPLMALCTGEVSVKCYKGNVLFNATQEVPHSLYDAESASMEAIGDFNHEDSEGFLKVLGVHARALHRKGITPGKND